MEKPVEVKGIIPQAVPARWPALEAFLHLACEKDIEQKITTGTLYESCRAGEAMLVEITQGSKVRGAAVLTRTDISYGRHLFVQALGGTGMADWLKEFVDFLDRSALANGCKDGILFCGRIGWQRQLADLGFEPVLVTMRRGIN